MKDEDIFPDLEKTPVMDSNRAPAPGDSSPELDVLAISNDPGEPPDPVVESRGGGERMDAADEGRRARLRQVIAKSSRTNGAISDLLDAPQAGQAFKACRVWHEAQMREITLQSIRTLNFQAWYFQKQLLSRS